jgi:uncharacterized membrane protein YhiD involved in acid resistance
MPKVNLHSLVRPKVFWPSIIILLILCVILYALKEKEQSLRISTQKDLSKTTEEKKVVENSLQEAKKEITAKDQQIKIILYKLEGETAARKETEARLNLVMEEKKVLEAKLEEINIELEKIRSQSAILTQKV